MKRALVTGASEGIGREFVKRLAKEGYVVTSVARNESRLQELTTEIGGENRYLTADLSTLAGVQKISEELSATKYDLLVNNAGFGVYGAFYETPLEKFQQMLRTNCDALVALSHAFLKNSKKGDALINVASTLAFLPMPKSGLYSASKAFVTSFSESLWYEQKPRGVYVMCLCPGATSTNFHERAGGREGEIPKAILQTPAQVIDVAMSALKKRSKPTVISGPQNFLFASLARVMPRKTTVMVMGRVR